VADGFLLAIAGVCASASVGWADEVTDGAKAAVQKYVGLQSEWLGPTSAPKPQSGKKIVYLSGDENIDTSHEYGVYMKEAAAKLGWDVTVIDGKGSPSSWLAAFNQAIALKPDGIAIFADAASLQDPIRAANAQHIVVIGLHAAGTPGAFPDLGVFFNIQGDPRNVGKAQAEWAIADSDGKARVVILTHNEYKIAETKSTAAKTMVEKCKGCQVLEYANSPASQADQRMAQLTTSWIQRFGPPLYITSVGDNDFDFAVRRREYCDSSRFCEATRSYRLEPYRKGGHERPGAHDGRYRSRSTGQRTLGRGAIDRGDRARLGDEMRRPAAAPARVSETP